MSVRLTRAIFHNPRFEEALYHLKKTFTRYPFRHEFEQYLVMNSVKSRFDISLNNPVVFIASIDVAQKC
jgi:hypothetical protein